MKINRMAFIEDLFGNAKQIYKSATVTVMSRSNYIISLGSHPYRQLFVLKKNLVLGKWEFYGVNCAPYPSNLKRKLKKLLSCDTMRLLLEDQGISVHDILADCIQAIDADAEGEMRRVSNVRAK